MISEYKVIYIEDKDTKHAYRYDFNDIRNSFKRNIKVGSNYEFTLTITYSEQFKEAYYATKGKCGVWYDGQFYNVQSMKPGIDEHGYRTKEIKCTHTIIDCLKNIRIDDPEPTEDNPTITGGNSSGSSSQGNSQPQAGVTVTKTAEKQTYSLESCLHKFIDNNDQGVTFEIHGAFPSLSVEQKGSLYDWITQNFKAFGAYWIPDGLTLKVYDLASLTHKTDKAFRYMSNMTNANVDYNFEDMVNDCWVYGGKMKKDITTVSDSADGGGGNLDNVEEFAKSPINANFGVNKEQMVNDFANRSQKVRARGVDVNRLYDTIKNAGVSPEWFFAYELQEQNSNMGWLNHWSYPHGDPYNDAVVVCNWIKEIANSDYLKPAWSAAEGSIGADSGLEAKWNQEFGKGTIGRLYLQATAAAVWELSGKSGNSYIGKPLAGCVSTIKGWGGHTQQAGGGSWGWPFPSVGEGSFTAAQKFGSGSGWIRPGLGTDFHDGLDFGSVDHPGSEVHAIHGGTCTVSRAWGNGGINWYCVIQDASGLNVEYQEAFGSASDIFVNVGQKVKTGDVIGRRNTSHLHIGITKMNIQQAFGHAGKNDGTWLDPQQVIKNGGAGDSGSSSASDSQPTSSTTSEEYYSLAFHYEDQESIKLYGRHRGKPIVEDSIYDMNTLKQYVENTVQHMPATVLTIDGAHMDGIQKGDQIKLIAPELQLNVDVVLMGIEGPDEELTGESADGITVMFNNTGDAMRDVNSAIWKDVSVINNNLNPLNIYGATGQRQENHFDNQSNQKDTSKTDQPPKYTQEQMDRLSQFTDGKDVKLNG
ncbi:phage tail protein [Limosilactobacillus reuteri]|uniref:phage tail protein n=1 Tax=Limosilactobacillus reuteri TaxID=1598 RepID=UPI001E5B0CDE|nr:phage tail protein [Limosilactobacillus reuteri]MCC4518089.1 phage tail protein [Limosilactobacillus reuteri]